MLVLARADDVNEEDEAAGVVAAALASPPPPAPPAVAFAESGCGRLLVKVILGLPLLGPPVVGVPVAVGVIGVALAAMSVAIAAELDTAVVVAVSGFLFLAAAAAASRRILAGDAGVLGMAKVLRGEPLLPPLPPLEAVVPVDGAELAPAFQIFLSLSCLSSVNGGGPLGFIRSSPF